MAKRGARKSKVKPLDERRDAGTDAAQRKRELYGTDGSDPIGRAYRMGLLGEDGQKFLQTGRSINRAYWAAYGQYSFTCALGTRTGAANENENSLERERWLNHTLREIDSMGREYRKAFDELCIDFAPDYGPAWLDRLIAAQHELESLKKKALKANSDESRAEVLSEMVALGRQTIADWSKLAKALEVLSELSD